jgi:hypothetical protein
MEETWRHNAAVGFEVVIHEAQEALECLKQKEDHEAQIHGLSALKECAVTLRDIAAATERKL